MGEERREAETVASSLDSNSDFSILNLISVTNVDFFFVIDSLCLVLQSFDLSQYITVSSFKNRHNSST